MKTVKDIRNEFLNFFEDKGHTIVSSSSLVPQNDPTLMFTNAGMNQFKDVFTGKEKRDYTRATTSQKCVRAGGKHNDLENVGYTARHHTFFEMLGNFSFGDYFKEDAIAFAWELVTKNFELDPNKLCVTVYHTDDEAFNIWKKVAGFHDDKIIRIATDDNFWRMGDTGPCGPCTEIFYDHGDHIWGGPPGSAEEDGDRFIEIWNNVFMQYEQIDADTRIELPAQSVDTGMGLERIAATLMGSNNNYDIDIMRSLIEHSADLTGFDAGSPSHKVVADHLRSAAFLIADGVTPSNEGRGYVLRRIMRRGMRHAHLMGAKDPMMHKVFPTLLSKMGEAYPELKTAESTIVDTLESEEKRFKTTLDRGLKMLDEETDKLASGAKFPGDVAFKLYDTYGFPLDLTQDALRAKDIDVDTGAFEACMAEQKERARAAWSGAGGAANEKIWFDILDEQGPTEFLGYEHEECEAQILAIVKGNDRVNEIAAGEEGYAIVNQTPFYAESGGQVGDSGTMSVINAEGSNITVSDVKKQVGALFVHVVTAQQGGLKVGDNVALRIDTQRRDDIRANHSATHLLHEALRQVLGDHVAQKGSQQDDARTRFDISHNAAITAQQITQVEAIVNEEIRANTPVVTRIMPIDEAKASGAMALFGEKYDDEVRVVTMGRANDDARAFSVELCGGTHVQRTGDIGLLKIVSEGALSSGVRRIEALTGRNAFTYLNQQEQILKAAAGTMKATPAELSDRIKSLMDDRKALEKEVSDLRKQVAMGGGASGSANDDVKDVAGVKFTGKVLAGFPAKDLKPMADDLKKQLGSGVVVLVATDSGKASIVVGVTDDLTDRVSAVDLVRVGSAALGGKGGGGRPDMAQAGGPNADDASTAVTAIETALAG